MTRRYSIALSVITETSPHFVWQVRRHAKISTDRKDTPIKHRANIDHQVFDGTLQYLLHHDNPHPIKEPGLFDPESHPTHQLKYQRNYAINNYFKRIAVLPSYHKRQGIGEYRVR